MNMDDILPQGSTAGGSKARKEKSNAIKQQAEELMAGRDQIVQNEENGRKVKIRH